MTAQVIELFPQARTLPTEPFWTEPDWCGRDCIGGDDVEIGGVVGTTDRYHVARLAGLTAPEGETGRPTRVQVQIERCDDRDGPGAETVTLHVGGNAARISFDDRCTLIAALTLANQYDA